MKQQDSVAVARPLSIACMETKSEMHARVTGITRNTSTLTQKIGAIGTCLHIRASKIASVLEILHGGSVEGR